MSGKEASASNAASASSSTTQLGHRKTAKNRNSTRKRTAKKNLKVVPVSKPEEKVIDQKDSEAAANTTTADEKTVDMPRLLSDDNKAKEDLEMTSAPEEVVIPTTEVFKQTEDAEEPAEDSKPKNITVIEDPLPTEDSKGAIGNIPDDEPTRVAETEEEDITAKELIEEKPKNIIDPTKEDQDFGKGTELADDAGTAENKTAGKAAKKHKKRHRKTQKNRKRALDLGVAGLNKPAVQASGADEPNIPASGADEPAVLDSAANEPKASSSEAKEPTTSADEQPARALSPRAMLLKQFEVCTDDEGDDDYDPDDRNNEERDWDVQDGVWELYE